MGPPRHTHRGRVCSTGWEWNSLRLFFDHSLTDVLVDVINKHHSTSLQGKPMSFFHFCLLCCSGGAFFWLVGWIWVWLLQLQIQCPKILKQNRWISFKRLWIIYLLIQTALIQLDLELARHKTIWSFWVILPFPRYISLMTKGSLKVQKSFSTS